MASSMMLSSAAVTSTPVINRAAPAQSVAPFTGLKSNAAFPATGRKTNSDLSQLPSNGGRVQCMKVWPPKGLLKFETLSYLPPLSQAQLAKQVDYLIKSGWVPCLEFDEVGFVRREYHRSPGYYDGRYWTMWKLPMFGCTDSSQVLAELEEAKKAYPNSFVRILGFDNLRQVQCCMFIAYKPK
ncbi:ribulose bisphosphate carboxylase small subunit, chloroplastic 5-like [Tasmannia lanceolata]|uniref:ribulose bisphosphate carboxylase small subunit, chloroplastic 5-like n=1 Tax=Tasmannia lanceolata TaxID=3420 RepID=UPI0040635326